MVGNRVSRRVQLRRKQMGDLFSEKVNDKPRLSYGEGLANHFKRHPPRKMVEPMFHGHWHSLEDYEDLGDLDGA